MKFQKNTRRRAKEYEKELKQKLAPFTDGPPFITGVPHHGTLLTSVVKDAIPRYWTMKGKRVERRWGWDCHGLPAEVFTEKKLGIKDKRDIGTKISLEDYITTCRTNMVQTGNEWEDVIDRIGYTKANEFSCTVPVTQHRLPRLKLQWIIATKMTPILVSM